MKIFITICTFIIGVLIEYFVLLEPLHKGNSFFDYLFVFTIIALPSLFLFGVPISFLANQLIKRKKYWLVKAIIIHGIGGMSAAMIILLISLPREVLTDIFHKQYLFFILNGVWFSFLFLFLDEIGKKCRSLMKRKNKDIAIHSS